jgi:hypothetical protein
MECDYWPVDTERMRREFEEGVARRQVEIRARLEKVEQRWEEGEEARRREWEALEGRLMNAYEENQHFNDGLLRKMTVMTEEYIRILREGGAIFQKEMAEGRAQLRANTEAVLKALDRLPPPQGG